MWFVLCLWRHIVTWCSPREKSVTHCSSLEVLKSQYTMSAHKFLICTVWSASDETENIYISYGEQRSVPFWVLSPSCFGQWSLRGSRWLPILKVRIFSIRCSSGTEFELSTLLWSPSLRGWPGSAQLWKEWQIFCLWRSFTNPFLTHPFRCCDCLTCLAKGSCSISCGYWPLLLIGFASLPLFREKGEEVWLWGMAVERLCAHQWRLWPGDTRGHPHRGGVQANHQDSEV